MNEMGCHHARFDGSSTSGLAFLRQLLDLGQPDPGSFSYEQELREGALLEHTKADAIILAGGRERRRQQLEAELQEEERYQREEVEQTENVLRGGMTQLHLETAEASNLFLPCPRRDKIP